MAEPGERPGATYFKTKLRPEEPKKVFFGDRAPPLSKTLDDRPLYQGLDPALGKRFQLQFKSDSIFWPEVVGIAYIMSHKT